jgi:hypothetical protein
MFKNVASQKIALFAFDATSNVPKTGDAANLTAYVSKDHGAVTVLGDTSATEFDATNAPGWYWFDLTQAETNADNLMFTGKSATANIKIVGRALTTLPANFGATSINSSGQLDMIKMAGTTLTGRDIGASVLLSSGTGAGQVSLSSGLVDITQAAADKVWSSATRTLSAFSTALAVSVWDVLASAVATASSIGLQIKTNLDVVLSTRLGTPAGASLSADLATLLSRLSSARAGYMDNLNVGGNVASSAEVTAIQNNTRAVFSVPEALERPDSSTTVHEVHLYLYDEIGNMEAPDSAPTLTLTNQAGTDRSSRLDSTTMALVNTGHYKGIYTASSGDAIEQLLWEVSVVEGGATRKLGRQTQVVDTTAVDFTSSDRTVLGAIKTVTDLLPNAGALSSLAQDSTVAKAAALATAQTAITAIKAVTDLIPNAGAMTNLDAAISTRATPAQVLTQVNSALDAANTEVTAVPAATASLRDMWKYLFAWRRNKKLQTSSTMKLRNDADTADIASSTVADDGTTLTIGKDA